MNLHTYILNIKKDDRRISVKILHLFKKLLNFKIEIFIALISLFLTIYFFIPPNIVYLNEKPLTGKDTYTRIGNRYFWEQNIDLYFTNKSIRNESIENIEIFPNGIFRNNSWLVSFQIDKTIIRRRNKKKISLKLIVEQGNFERKVNILQSEPLVVRFFDNNGSLIVDKNGNVATIIVGFSLLEKQ